MELLGFLDNPGTATTRAPSSRPDADVTAGRHLPPGDKARIADRAPTELGSELLKGNFRWSALVALILIGAGIAALGAWVTQRPVADRALALAGVQAGAAELRPAVAGMNELNESLSAPEVAIGSVNEALSAVDDLARELFTASAVLPQSEATHRARATAASGDALDATKLLREAYAYRAAVLPVLAAPTLETDPELIEIDEAVRQFGAWQARFDEIRTALPTEVMERVTDELDSVSAQLDTMLSDYVDALRSDDAAAAADVLAGLERRLAATETALFTALGDTQTRVQRHIDSSLFALDLLVS
jgi:hypothetical protein